MEQTWQSVVSFLVRNQGLLMGLVFWPVITAVMNIALRKKTPEEWEKWAIAKPGLAFLLEVLRAMGLDPIKLLQAFHRYAKRRAGVIPADAVRLSSLPDPLKVALANPETLKRLTELAAQIQAEASAEKEPASG